MLLIGIEERRKSSKSHGPRGRLRRAKRGSTVFKKRVPDEICKRDGTPLSPYAPLVHERDPICKYASG